MDDPHADLPKETDFDGPNPSFDPLAYAQSIIDTVREPLLVLDSTLRVKTASRSFYELFGVVPEDSVSHLIYNLGNGQWNIPTLRKLLKEVLTKSHAFHDYEVNHEFPLLGERVMLLNARRLWTKAGDSDLILLAIEDITDRKRLTDDLVRSNQDLQRFAYTAAHDLRSPLNSALQLSRLLEKRASAKLDGTEREMLQHAIESMQRLGKLMNDILAYAESGNVPQLYKSVGLDEPVRFAIANLRHHIQATQATIHVGELPSVETDPTQMAIVFQNLIGNAIKYRRNNFPLHISIEAIPFRSGWRVSVSDNGQGFDIKKARFIFEPFKRLHGTDIRGSGIGLATCKRIVERWGGEIWADSVWGEGSTFFFTIPNR